MSSRRGQSNTMVRCARYSHRLQPRNQSPEWELHFGNGCSILGHFCVSLSSVLYLHNRSLAMATIFGSLLSQILYSTNMKDYEIAKRKSWLRAKGRKSQGKIYDWVKSLMGVLP